MSHTLDPAAALAALAASQAPLLIGVRHHSPACAAAIPALLDGFQPERLLIELPHELGEWMAWIGHPAAQAPLALAAMAGDGGALFFYPFADFSPELAAIRWAVQRGIPVEPLDLPVAMREQETEQERDQEASPAAEEGREHLWMERLLAREEVPDSEALWDRMVEARAPGAGPEAVRRAALLVGWGMRLQARVHPPGGDLLREAWMRSRIAASAKERVAVVIGAFHAAALLPVASQIDPLPRVELPKAKAAKKKEEVTTSLIPYTFELLDSRSGYPAGIRDPAWQQQVWSQLAAGGPLEPLVAEAMVKICRELRRKRHPAGAAEAREAMRMALDLARLRGLPAPGRRELLEGLETVMAQGEPLGRGRALAQAIEPVMVGSRRGQLAPGTPRSGLTLHVEELLRALKLPEPGRKKEEILSLDPLRSELDRRRHVAMWRLSVTGVPYGEIQPSQSGGETLKKDWKIQWKPATDAMLEMAGLRGVTLAQAAAGALRAEARVASRGEGLTPAMQLELLSRAAECGLPRLVRQGMEALMGDFLVQAGLTELVGAATLVERIRLGQVPGLPRAEDGAKRKREIGAVEPFTAPPNVRREDLIAAAIRALDGLTGSDRPEDASALLQLAQTWLRLEEEGAPVGDGRIGWSLDRLALEGVPFMQGVAGAIRVLLRRSTGAMLGADLGASIDAAVTLEARRALAARLEGLSRVAAPLLESNPDFLAGVMERVSALTDAEFLQRVAAMRHGFSHLSPAARQRLLDVVGDALAAEGLDVDGLDAPLELPAAWLEALACADRAGRDAAALALDPLSALPPAAADPAAASPAAASPTAASPAPRDLSPLDRWRLLLGREAEKLEGMSASAARALEELYGQGSGEGSRTGVGASGGNGAGAGRESRYPTIREWADDIEALFGEEVREEVLGRAAAMGRAMAALELNPDNVEPSVDLLETVLSLKGALPESQLGQLRRIIDRVVQQLLLQLSTRIRPALVGLSTPRPTRRPGGPLDLRRTIGANLQTARPTADGWEILPERLIFKTRSRRTMDWRLILVVDVSGSMEASVIYSALMAAILHGLPALQVHFLAFSTEVIDLTERVTDPLGLLLEVEVGGGTHIAKALRHARGLLTVPTRSIVVTISDFEEGWPVDALVQEVRTLVGVGAKVLGLAALDDTGKPRYSKPTAEQLVSAGMPVAALTPLELARWVGEQIR